MPLSTYPFLKDDTRLILHKDTVYKVKVKCVDSEVIKNVNFPFTEQAAHHQIEQVLRAVFYADERNSELKPILTEHLLITPVKVPWKAARHFGFKKDDNVLKTFPFVFQIDVRVRDEIVENVKKATTKSAIIQQPSKRDDKKDQTFQSSSSENRIEKQLNNEIAEDDSSTADPSKPSTSNTALERDETGRFHRVIVGNKNQSPQEQLITSECVKKYKEILQNAQSKTGTQKNIADQEVRFPYSAEAAVSPSNLESQGGSETMKQPSQTKMSSQSKDKSRRSPCKRERKSKRIHLPKKMRDNVSVNVNEDVSGRRKKNNMINLEDISKGDADLEMEKSEKPEIPRLSRKRDFDEKGTENEKARSVGMNKSKRTYQSSRTDGPENSTSLSGSYSEQERHIGKRLRSADRTEKHILSFKMSHRNDNSVRDKVLVGVDNNQNESHGHKTKSVHNKNPIETNSSTSISVVTEDMKRKRKDNSGVQRKMVLKNVTASAQRIQTRSQRIADLDATKVTEKRHMPLKKVHKIKTQNQSEETNTSQTRSQRIADLDATKVTEKRHMPLKKVHKIKTQNQSEETNTFSLGLHRCDEINSQSAISPRISHVMPFKSTKSDQKQNPPESPLRIARNLDRQVSDENLNPSTSNQAQRTQGQEWQIGDETDRLLNMSLRNPPERRISNRRSLDRYMIERDELEETLKLQQLAQSTSPRRSPRKSAKTSTASSRKRSGLWGMMETFITPVKKLFKSD